MSCTYCGSKTHPTAFCPKTSNGQANQKLLNCGYCGSKLHSIHYCPKTAIGPSNRRNNPDGEFLD